MSPFWIALAMAGCFAVGLLFGILLHKVTSPSLKKRRRLEGQMDQIREEYVRYQAGVTQHFSESAALVKRLNKDYQALISHLARGAGELSADPESEDKEMLSRLSTTAPGSAESRLSDPYVDNYQKNHQKGDEPASHADSDHHDSSASNDYTTTDYGPKTASSAKISASSRKKASPQNVTASVDSDPLQVPGDAPSSIQGAGIAAKHVSSADYNKQQVDGYVQAPRDYAPRRGPEDSGTLAETYGLDRGDVKK